MFGTSQKKPRLVRFDVRYEVAGRVYETTMPGISAAHVRSSWKREKSTLLSAEESSMQVEFENGSRLIATPGTGERMRSKTKAETK